MKKIIFLLFASLFLTNLKAQLYHKKYLALKKNGWVHPDTTSKYLIEKYKDIPNLLVQIRDSYEHEDLKIFERASNIKRLSIYTKSVNSLNGLQYLPNLESLSIGESLVNDFSSIRDLRKLKSLTIDSKVLINTPLELDSLEELKYSCNYDLRTSHFPSLKTMKIHRAVSYDTEYEDYENYGIKYKLEEPCCPIVLNHFDSLQEVRIYDFNVSNLEEVALPSNLKKLYIGRCNQLVNVDMIKKVSSLEELGIFYCSNIESFEFLKDLNDVKWRVRYKGRLYGNNDLNQLLNHPKEIYYFADEKDEYATDSSFYNFHYTVIERSKVVFEKYHQRILDSNLSRKDFLDLIPPLLAELNELCTAKTCNIDWNDDETYYVIDFLRDMSLLIGYEFKDSHLYSRFEY